MVVSAIRALGSRLVLLALGMGLGLVFVSVRDGVRVRGGNRNQNISALRSCEGR